MAGKFEPSSQGTVTPTGPVMEILIIVGLCVGFGLAIIFWLRYPAASTGKGTNQEQEDFIETYVFPAGIKRKVLATYPHLSEAQLAQVHTGLRDFFHACQQASQVMVGMPSQVVDVAWHEFILDTREYQYFCERAFDRFLHHTPAEAMPSDTDAKNGLTRTWHLCCTREGIDPKAPTRLPLLFALDSDLQIPDGFLYSLEAQKDDSAPYCAKDIRCTWVPSRQDPPKRFEPVSANSGKNHGSCGGCASSCGGGGCGGD